MSKPIWAKMMADILPLHLGGAGYHQQPRVLNPVFFAPEKSLCDNVMLPLCC